MRVLVGCECSGIVREAFRKQGHDAWSVDLKGDEKQSQYHVVEDVLKAIIDGGPWDLLIAFPPCTHLAVSGARWFPEKRADGRQEEALNFVRALIAAPVPLIAIENPVSIISSCIRRADQTIQPWQFGHGEVKATCLWLKGLPLLRPTNIVEGREARVWKMAPSPTRAADRARTLPGIAEAMADQWGRPFQIQEELFGV